MAEICGDNLELWINAVNLFFEAERYELAVGCCENYLARAKDKNGENGHVQQIKVRQAESWYRIHKKSGDLAKAVEQKKLLAEEIDPENNDYLQAYAEALVEARNFKGGAEAYAELLARFPTDNAGALWTLKADSAACSLRAGDAAKALDILKGFNAANPAGLPEAVRTRVTQVMEEATAARDQGKKDASKESTEATPEPAKESGAPAGTPPSTPPKGEGGAPSEGGAPKDAPTEDPPKPESTGGEGTP